jgi:hypothetical protein
MVKPVARLMTAVLLSLTVLLPGPSLQAQQVSLGVHPGWDKKDPPFTSGYVIYGITSRGKCDGPKLLLTYGLKGAERNTAYKLYIGLFNLPPAGLPAFGAPRYNHGVYTRDGITAQNDGYIVGDFKTNDSGDGEGHVELDLTGVPSGTYDAQFTWGTPGIGSIVYRTGDKYGVGFAKIKVPSAP